MKYLFLYSIFLVNITFSQTSEYDIVDSSITEISESIKIKNVSIRKPIKYKNNLRNRYR